MTVKCKKCGHIENGTILMSENLVFAKSKYGEIPTGTRCPKCNGEWENIQN